MRRVGRKRIQGWSSFERQRLSVIAVECEWKNNQECDITKRSVRFGLSIYTPGSQEHNNAQSSGGSEAPKHESSAHAMEIATATMSCVFFVCNWSKQI